MPAHESVKTISTHPSDELQRRRGSGCAEGCRRVAEPDHDLPAAVHAKHGMNRAGKRVNYCLNYSSEPRQLTCAAGSGIDLPARRRSLTGGITVKRWDLAIVEEE
jgi:hypothetical protein